MLPVDLAVEQKWLAGRARYGETWQGAHPLIELYDELLDGLSYEQEAARRGRGVPRARAHLRAAAEHLRQILLEVGAELEQGKEATPTRGCDR